VAWYKAPTSILRKDSNGNDTWSSDGELNSSYLALDYHIEQGCGDQTALIYDAPVTNSTASYTYSELRDEVATFAGVLDSLSISKGDRTIIYMPMLPQAAIAMHARANRSYPFSGIRRFCCKRTCDKN
jgi:propionyl-CoA synthetase